MTLLLATFQGKNTVLPRSSSFEKGSQVSWHLTSRGSTLRRCRSKHGYAWRPRPFGNQRPLCTRNSRSCKNRCSSRRCWCMGLRTKRSWQPGLYLPTRSRSTPSRPGRRRISSAPAAALLIGPIPWPVHRICCSLLTFHFLFVHTHTDFGNDLRRHGVLR